MPLDQTRAHAVRRAQLEEVLEAIRRNDQQHVELLERLHIIQERLESHVLNEHHDLTELLAWIRSARMGAKFVGILVAALAGLLTGATWIVEHFSIGLRR